MLRRLNTTSHHNTPASIYSCQLTHLASDNRQASWNFFFLLNGRELIFNKVGDSLRYEKNFSRKGSKSSTKINLIRSGIESKGRSDSHCGCPLPIKLSLPLASITSEKEPFPQLE